jgi:two-component system copper resistance phosphate regulon response regulator CusR
VSRILMVEDEPQISNFVDRGLRHAGHLCTVVANGPDGLDRALSGSFDLLLLDVGLPGMDGFEVLRQVRIENTTLPVVMLTAWNSPMDTVAGLNGGANDYIAKPFTFEELLARINLRLRDAKPAGMSSTIEYSDIVLDLLTRRVSVGLVEFELSAREFALAEEFLRHPDQVLSRERLLERVWGLSFDPGTNVVDVYVRYLRAKLGADRIESVRGAGYRLT